MIARLAAGRCLERDNLCVIVGLLDAAFGEIQFVRDCPTFGCREVYGER